MFKFTWFLLVALCLTPAAGFAGITNVVIIDKSETTVTISWHTDILGTTEIKIGEIIDGTCTWIDAVIPALDTTGSTEHTYPVSGLIPNKTYCAEAKSKEPGSTEYMAVEDGSSPLNFTTLQSDVIITDLGTLDGRSYAYKINSLGQIAGYYQRSDLNYHTFLITPEDTNDDGSPDLWYRDTEPADGVNDLMIDIHTIDTDKYNHSVPRDLNNLGQIVGIMSTPHASTGYIWSEGEGMRGLGYSTYQEPLDINELGNVVGRRGGSSAFYWTPEDGEIVLNTLGGNYGTAYAINNLNHVVGSSQTEENKYRAVLWQGSGSFQNLGTLGGDWSIAKVINDAGQIAGQSINESSLYHLFLITPEDTNDDGSPDLWYRDTEPADGVNDLMIDFGNLGDLIGYQMSVHAINDLGQFTGYAYTLAGRRHAFLAITGEGMRDLGTLDFGTLENSSSSRANGINNLGLVAGESRTTFGNRPFLWTPEKGMVDLGINGETLRNQHHHVAYAISDGINGHVQVVGYSLVIIDGEYHTRATLWQVPISPLNPQDKIDQLIDSIKDLILNDILNKGEANGLISKLEAANKMLDKDNTTAACNVLQAFINQVNAMVQSGRLTPDEGNELINAASSFSMCS